ncbi:putative peptide transporter ptr2 [Smittium mucronatum]|uniref:Putative peptide transporter ptr2 n=1 Tax=Smittium mucronatum TaxID=133383 RepID=A0A1R0GQ79_9FUNG|nr:putative peptide transporter ptr2 [Smittium mucronatum]
MADIEKFYDHPDALMNDDGYMQEQPADFIGGIPEPLRISAWLIISTELCERFTYYGASLMFAQYLKDQLKLKKTDQVSIIRGFTFFCYFTTLFGAFIADQFLGKYLTITAFASWYVIGTALLSISALTSIERSTRLALFIVSTYLFIGIGTGGIKSNVSAYVAEQVKTGYKPTKTPGIYIDSRATIERCYRYFYMAINVGAFAGMLLCPQLAKNVNYFTAYVVPAGVMAVGLIIFVPGYRYYVKKPIGHSPFVKVYRTIRYALRNKNPNNAHWLDSSKGLKDAEWDDKYVDGLKRSIRACKVFLFYPIYWALYNNMTDNFINQGLEMKRPNWLSADQLNVINSAVLIITIPIFDTWVFPALAKRGIYLGPIKKIFIGFMIVSAGFVYVTVIQKFVYKSGPYYEFNGPDVPEDAYNDISVWWQVPAYVSIGISEIFASITGLEYAFSQAPAELKSTLTALFLFSNAGGSLLGMILAIWSGDPTVLYTFAAQSVLMFVFGVAFYFIFRHYDEEVRQMTTYDG